VACAPITTTTVTPTTVPADLPSRDEAEAIARALLADTGMQVDDAKVTVDGPYDGWYVNVELQIDGMRVSGLSATVGVGSKGEILNAGGMLGSAERVGDYPTIDTRKAIDRLNEGTAFGAGGSGEGLAVEEDAVAVDDSGRGELTSTTLAEVGGVDPDSPTTNVAGEPIAPCAADAIARIEAGEAVPTTVPGTDPALVDPYPCGPPEPLEPTEVVLHEAERILVMIGANDGSGDLYLVPGYEMTGDHDWVVDVPSVDDESLLPTTPVKPSDTGDDVGTAGGTDGSVTPVAPADPGTTRCAQPEPGPDGAVPDICLDPNTVEPSEGTTTGSLDPG
jgi:hypothetical protein